MLLTDNDKVNIFIITKIEKYLLGSKQFQWKKGQGCFDANVVLKQNRTEVKPSNYVV